MKKWLVVVVLALTVTLFGSSSLAQTPHAGVTIAWTGTDQWQAQGIWPGPAWLGVRYSDNMITEVVPFSPAHTAGLREGDRVMAMLRVQHRWDGSYSFRLSDSPFGLSDFPAYCRPGDLVLIVFWRDDGSSALRYNFKPHVTVAVLGSK